ncbi:hypothetical protein [Persicobacter psychrovividus]|uniref:Tetratricopeptide repeat protein n=1 Tax=Persicobacter psychrovividus TaxID=387638 RepID=A0ABM7VE47_9BACT|nr:hypothetical protein PEPS_14840 [Persicobacter psychrovividus]
MKRLFVTAMMVASMSAVSFAQVTKGSSTKAQTLLTEGKVDEAKTEIDNAFSYMQDQVEKITAKKGAEKAAKKAPKAKDYLAKGKIYTALALKDTANIDESLLKEGVAALHKVDDLEKPNSTYPIMADQTIESTWGAIFNQGATAYGAADYKTAVKYFNQSKIIKADTTAFLYSAIAASQEGSMQQATLDNFKGYIEAKKALNDTADMLYYQQVIYLEKSFKEDYQAALDAVNAARVYYPTDKNMIQEMVGLYLKLEQPDMAIEKIQKEIDADPKNEVLFYDLGYVYDQLATSAKKNEDKEAMTAYSAKALKAYEDAVAVNPKYYDAVFNIAVNHYNTAAATWNEANDMSMDEYRKRGAEVENKAKEQFRKSLPFFEKARELKPNDRMLLETLAGTYLKIGDKAKAAEIQKQLESIPE